MDALTSAHIELAAIFDRLAVPYAVMGGLAVRIYGSPRPTYDLDFTLAIGRDRLPELYEALDRDCLPPAGHLGCHRCTLHAGPAR